MSQSIAVTLLQRELEKALEVERDILSSLHVAQAQSEELQQAINTLLGKSAGVAQLPFVEVKEKKESGRKAIARTIKEAKRFVHVREIADLLKQEFPEDNWDADAVSRGLTAYKAYNKDHGLITVSKGLKANTFHGLKEWVTEEDKNLPKPEYMYDERLLVLSTKEYMKDAA